MRTPQMIFGIFALSLASTSCLRPKTTQVRVLTPPPVQEKPVVKVDPPTPLAKPPQIAVDAATVATPHLPDTMTEITSEIPEAPKRVARRTVTPVPPKPATTGSTPPEPTITPKLSQIFTPEEQREYTRILDESLDKVNRQLATIEGKTLTAEQKETAERIRTFQKQAEQVREQDLLTAVSLAKRADLLAKDLLEHLP